MVYVNMSDPTRSNDISPNTGECCASDEVPELDGDVGSVGGGADDSIASTRSPLELCERSLDRALSMISHATAASADVRDDIGRSAIVLAVAALDGYVRRMLFAKIADTISNQANIQDFDAWVNKNFEKTELLNCIRSPHRIDSFMDLVSAKLDELSFQGPKRIVFSFRLVGIHDIIQQACASMGRPRDDVWKLLDKHTTRRHQIAHQADLDWTQHPFQERTLSHEDVMECIELIRTFAQSLERVLR